MKNVGIWLDKRDAFIITTSSKGEQLQHVQSDIEEYHIKGGAGTRHKGGPQDVVQDSKYLEREKHQYQQYFSEITQALPELDQLVLFGPAETPAKFDKELKLNYKGLAEKVKDVIKADNMTLNQKKALVREYFNS